MASLQHILREEDAPSMTSPSAATSFQPPPLGHEPMDGTDPILSQTKSIEVPDDDDDDDDEVAVTPKADGAKADEYDPAATSLSVSTRRHANGNTSSVFSGNKIRHLKKEDGIPLWRKDIQYDFLKLVFDDQTTCFTKYSDGTKGHTFADVYIDAMAKSSKCSKILKEKLLADRTSAICMAMVCLLVNVGRMNTTLNFFPEMRAQLRTYHSIPALQAHQDPNAYKALQDAPRLKSILKGATEDEPQPSTVEEITATARPRTNAVNLIFVMSQYALKISEIHFNPPRDFFELVMRHSLSSASRANAFLWLLWWYLESDFSYADSQSNPFGPGLYGEGEEGTDVLPLRVPALRSLTEEEAEMENVDTPEERHFGDLKKQERSAILVSDPSPAMTALKRARRDKSLAGSFGAQPSDDEGSETGFQKGMLPASIGKSGLQHETGSEYTRSPSPAGSRGFQAVNQKPAGDIRINHLLNSDDVGLEGSPPRAAAMPTSVPSKKGVGRGNWRRTKKTDAAVPRPSQEGSHHIPLLPSAAPISFVNEGPQMQTTPSGLSPKQSTTISFQAPNTRDHVPTPSYQAQKRHRGVTQHQSAVLNHRQQQIKYTLEQRIRKCHILARGKRESEGSIVRAWKRIRAMPADYDSEEEHVKSRRPHDRLEKGSGGDEWRLTRGNKDIDGELELDLIRPARVLYAGFVLAKTEPADVGEEAKTLAQTFGRAARRLDRWQDSEHPGDVVLARQQRQRDGTLYPRRPSLPSPGAEGLEGMESLLPPPAAVGMNRPKGRGAGGRADADATTRRQNQSRNSRRAAGSAVGSAAPNAEPGDEEVARTAAAGTAPELDEEDRELLGEVDADETEEDEDEDMDD